MACAENVGSDVSVSKRDSPISRLPYRSMYSDFISSPDLSNQRESPCGVADMKSNNSSKCMLGKATYIDKDVIKIGNKVYRRKKKKKPDDESGEKKSDQEGESTEHSKKKVKKKKRVKVIRNCKCGCPCDRHHDRRKLKKSESCTDIQNLADEKTDLHATDGEPSLSRLDLHKSKSSGDLNNLSSKSGFNLSMIDERHILPNKDGIKNSEVDCDNLDNNNNDSDSSIQTVSSVRSASSARSDKSNRLECVCRCKVIKRPKRPEPEGGSQPCLNALTEYDQVLFSMEPLFSDLEDNSEEDEQIKQELDRHHKRHGNNIFGAAQLLHSNTMIKFAIISAELQNIVKISLRRAESEVQALTRRIRLLEEDFEQTETRLTSASEKLEEASKAADESERGRKVLANRNINDEERIGILEKELEETIFFGEESDRKYEEAARKLAVTEVDLERAEARVEAADCKILELEEELKVVGNNMKSLEISEQEASQREESYEESIRDLTARLKDAENRATEAERTVSKLQKEVDRLEDELLAEKEKYKNISEDLDATFSELAGF